MIKTSIYCLVIALTFKAALCLRTQAQTDERRDLNTEPRDIVLADHLHGEWLRIGRINHKEPGAEFNPNWTYIRCAEGVVPVMKKQGKFWAIQFDSEIARNLP